MEYSTLVEGNTCRVRLSGRLTNDCRDHFLEVVNCIKQDGVSTLNLDMSAVDFIDSAGLGMLLIAHDIIDKQSFKLIISCPNGQMKKAFSISNFEQILTIVD